MSSCAVPYCTSKSRNGGRRFRIPKNSEKNAKWRKWLLIQGATKINENTRVCEKHFVFDEHGIRDDIPSINKSRFRVIQLPKNSNTPEVTRQPNRSVQRSPSPKSKCAVKSCSFQSKETFISPENPTRLEKWKKAVGTEEKEFYVCEAHFSQKDIVIEKSLDDDAVPSLHLSDESFMLENQCCGLCLEDVNEETKITRQFRELFKKISQFHPLTEFICGACQFAMEKYNEFQSEIQLKHAKIRNDALMKVTTEESNETQSDSEFQMIEEILECEDCHYQAATVDELNKHIETDHTFNCEICKFKSKSPQRLTIHYQLAHASAYKNLITSENGTFNHYCASCNLHFKSQELYNQHVKTHFTKGKVGPLILNQSIQEKNRIMCFYCHEMMEDKIEMRAHMEKFHPSHKNPSQLKIQSIAFGSEAKFGETSIKRLKKKFTPQRPVPEEIQPENASEDPMLKESEIKVEEDNLEEPRPHLILKPAQSGETSKQPKQLVISSVQSGQEVIENEPKQQLVIRSVHSGQKTVESLEKSTKLPQPLILNGLLSTQGLKKFLVKRKHNIQLPTVQKVVLTKNLQILPMKNISVASTSKIPGKAFCSECNINFLNLQLYLRHRHEKHPQVEQILTEEPSESLAVVKEEEKDPLSVIDTQALPLQESDTTPLQSVSLTLAQSLQGDKGSLSPLYRILKDKLYKCHDCKTSFITLEAFLQHRYEKHPKMQEINAEIARILTSKKDSKELHIIIGTRPDNSHVVKFYEPSPATKCKQCDIKLPAEKMEAHVKQAHDTKIRCQICGNLFKAVLDLKQHMIGVHGGSCDLCGAEFCSKEAIVQHMKSSHTKFIKETKTTK